jgi:hypothetical protein
MRTQTFSLLTLITILLATSCMPDSFTKFKEDPPTKKSASGGSSGDVIDATPTPTPTPEMSDVAFTVESLELYQSRGDVYFLLVADGTGFNVGDTINTSATMFPEAAPVPNPNKQGTFHRTGTIIAITVRDDASSDTERLLMVRLGDKIIEGSNPCKGGALNCSASESFLIINNDYDNKFSSTSASDHSSNNYSAYYKFFEDGYYIDNCPVNLTTPTTSGYGNCSPSSAAITRIVYPPILYIPSDPPSTNSFPMPAASGKNLFKRIRINGVCGTSGECSKNSGEFQWDYSFNQIIQGLGVRSGDFDGAANNTNSSDDYLVSPFGPFSIQSGLDFSGEDNVLTLTASLSEGTSNRGTQLDSVEQGSLVIPFTTVIPGDSVEEVQDFELTYYLPENSAGSPSRFAIEVDNVAGFVAGFNDGTRTIVRACQATSSTSCNADTDDVTIFGKATIEYIDEQRNILYLSALDVGGLESLFREGFFIHNGNSAGTVTTTAVSMQSSKVYRLFNDIGTTDYVVNARWNDQTDPNDNPDSGSDTVTYSIDSFPRDGFSINPSTGQITIEPDKVKTLDINRDITITATNDTTGLVIDTFVFNYNAIIAPSAFSYQDGAASKDLKVYLGENTDEQLTISGASNYVTDSISFAAFRFESTPALPTGAALNERTGELTWSPLNYNNTTSNYTLRAFFPAYNPGTGVADSIGSVTAKFLTASRFDKIVYDQLQNEILILKVSAIEQFIVDGKVSTANGAIGTVKFIDEENRRLFVQVDQDLVGCSSDGNSPQVFAPGDSLDSANSFTIERATIGAASDSVVHVFSTDTSATFPVAGRIPKLCLNTGIEVTLDSGAPNFEERDTLFAITPSLPDDITFSNDIYNGTTVLTSGNGAFIPNNVSDIGNLSETTYTVAVSNKVGDTVLSDYTMTVVESPSLPSFNRYQFVRIQGNTEKFYRGTRFQTNPLSGDQVSGRVLMTIDTDGDEITDGLLVEGNGDIGNGFGIDNAEVFFADEVIVKGFEYWYVKDATGFNVGDCTTVSSNNGATGIIRARDNNTATNGGQRLYVELGTGTFNGSHLITCGASNTTIKSIQRRAYVTGVVQIDNSSGQWSNVVIGERVTWSGGVGILVQKHRENNNTASAVDLNDDRYYVLLQHVSGDLIAQGDTLTFNAGATTSTVQAIVGPVVNLKVGDGNGVNTNSSSSGRVDSNGNPFYIGSTIGAFDGSSNNAYVSVGEAVFGTSYDKDVANSQVSVAVEDFFNHFTFSGTNIHIDDFTESNPIINMQGEQHADITGVEMSNLVIGYVGEPLYVQPSLKGEFAQASLTPSTIPAGLNFDTETGVLSGTPREPFAGDNFTIRFRTADGTSFVDYSFPMVVYNVFEITQKTDEASSYIVHKEGQGLGTSRCRVTSGQIIDDINDPNYNTAVYGLNDIVCLLEGGESDLYNRGVEFDIKFGAGMCEYVEYVPFSYQSLPAGASNRSITVYKDFGQISQCRTSAVGVSGDAVFITGDAVGSFIGNTSGTGTNAQHLAVFQAGNAADDGAGNTRQFDNIYCESSAGTDCVPETIASQFCTYDYRNIDEDLPNLDSGTITVRTVSCAFNPGTEDSNTNSIPDVSLCECTLSEPEEIECGGRAIDGLAGPKRDLLPSSYDINSGRIYTTVTGGSQSEEVSPPISKSLGTNRYLANFISHRNYTADTNSLSGTTDTPNPSCYASNHHMDGYRTVNRTLTGNRVAWESYSSNFDPFGNSNSGLYNNYYTFNCLDASYDIKARVRLMVRDWDREFTPEEHELTNLAANFVDGPDLGLTISGSSGNVSTLSGDLPAGVVIGTGTEIWVSSNATLDQTVDTRMVVQKFDRRGAAADQITFRTNPPSTGALNFFIRSRTNDDLANTFAVNYDNRLDFDGSYIGLLGSTYRPEYASCAESTVNEVAPTGTARISITGGSLRATFNESVDLPNGTVLEVDTGGAPATTTVTILFGSGSSYTLAQPAAFSVSGAVFRVYRKIPYPLELP